MTSDGAGELAQHLREISAAAGDLRPAFMQAAAIFGEAAEKHFASGGAGQWQAWSDEYASQTRSRQMLVRDGDLLASLADSSHHQHIRRIQQSSLEVGTKRPTATLHRHGRRGKREMPAREPMPSSSLFEGGWTGALRVRVTGESAQRLGA